MGFKYTPPAYSGTGDDNFWRFMGGIAPDNIELNSAVGVEGVNASLPNDRRLRFVILDTGGSKISGGAILLYKLITIVLVRKPIYR